MTFCPPSRNPTIDKRLRTVLRFVFNKMLQGTVDDMLPAVVIAYNRTTNMATVQSLIQVVNTLDQAQARKQIGSVPVLQLGGGGFMLNFFPKPGDMGFIKANDRDISLFTQAWKMVRPNTGRMHSFSDGIFIPATLTNFTINAADANNPVFQSIDGTTRLSMGDGNFCMADTPSYSQSVHAILDLYSTTRAFLPPRMTTGQKDAIPDPIEGMVVYDLTLHSLSTYTNTGWNP